LRKAHKVFGHVASIYTLVLDAFEEHVPLRERHVSTKAISPSGLYLSELRARMPTGRARDRRSMLRHVPGRDLRTMLWRETAAQTPRHDPAHEPLPNWAARWHTAYDTGADVTTYAGVRV
jgi:hypothetical protein